MTRGARLATPTPAFPRMRGRELIARGADAVATWAYTALPPPRAGEGRGGGSNGLGQAPTASGPDHSP
jgi:hypothetical protein